MSCCSSGAACTICKVVRGIVTFFLTLVTVAAFMGVYRTHMTSAGWVFGTTDASLAIVAFVLAVAAWFKIGKKLCGCASAGCSVCPGCGKEPCVCK